MQMRNKKGNARIFKRVSSVWGASRHACVRRVGLGKGKAGAGPPIASSLCGPADWQGRCCGPGRALELREPQAQAESAASLASLSL